MFGIPFLDSITSYEFCKFLSIFIKVGQAIFGVLTGGILFVDWLAWKPKRRVFKAVKGFVNATAIILLLFCIVYSADGRYSETELNNISDPGYTYFGTARDGKRFGFGKLFDSNHRIWEVADAMGDGDYDDVKQYTSKGEKTYLSFVGTYRDNKAEHHGTEYVLAGDDVRVQYDGEFFQGSFTGNGEFSTYDDNGDLTSSYSGSWSHGKKCGYGVYREYNGGKNTLAYAGTFWNGNYHGTGVMEYFHNGTHFVWYGNMDNGDHTSDYALYTDNETFECSTDNGTLNNDNTKNEDKINELTGKWPFPKDRLIE